MTVLPYVYRLTHKITGQFYIGYREANQLPASQDLPLYQSSSKVIHSLGFDNFEYEIIAELSTGQEAYDLENSIIKEHFDDPLCLNQHYVDDGKSRFRRTGPHTPETVNKMRGHRSEEFRQKMRDICQTEEYRSKMSEIKKNHEVSEETRESISKAISGKALSEEHKQSISKSRKGFKMSEEQKRKLVEAQRLRRLREKGTKLCRVYPSSLKSISTSNPSSFPRGRLR